MLDSIFFYFNGERSSDMGIYLVNVQSGLQTTPFLADKELITEKIIGNDTPYLYGTERSPIVLNITLSTLEEYWTFEKRKELAEWLDTDEFCEFYSSDDVYKKYYVQYTGGIDLTHNNNQQGYIEIQLTNISPYSYSPVYTDIFDFSAITTPTVFEFTNKGSKELQPEIWIQKIGTGDVSIKNLSNGGEIFKFTGLSDNEIIYVDNEHRDIETDFPDLYRYDNFNGNYLNFIKGVNRLEVTGACKIKFRYQFKIKG